MKNDPRNYLYEYYVEFLKEFNPDFFIFENVPGMRSAKKGYILKDFKNKVNKLGYNTEAKILDAGNFNVLQSRKRLIIIGHKTDNSFFETIGTSKKKKYNVSSILNDLPILNPGQGTDSQQQYRKEKISGYLNNFNIRTKKDVLIHHQARKHNERDRKIYRLAINTWNKEKRRIKYKELPEDLKTHKNRKSFEDRFKVIAANSKSHTIVAHISKDGHYYIHPDIKQARSITVREAARIQSFPDNYKFEGPRTSQYVQVGNAVPPLMAENLAQKTKEFIDS
jgi:DNA (cytosine-5)-methyltransferase 1